MLIMLWMLRDVVSYYYCKTEHALSLLSDRLIVFVLALSLSFVRCWLLVADLLTAADLL